MKKKKIQSVRSRLVLKRLEEHPRMAFKKSAAITAADKKGGSKNINSKLKGTL